ncbi:MAG: GSCFA domain-containing protein [Bradyrhizobiaceae bacterium]|nr:GSCFA domain-containing protein [Bradyrhizobiaceae bacterium]
MRLPASQAFANKDAPLARWPTARRRIRSGLVMPEIAPSFRIKPGDEVFTMGSCFARNIEDHLARLGCKISTHAFVLPAHELRQGVSGSGRGLTLFTTPVFRQIIEWSERIMQRDRRVSAAECEPYAFCLPDGMVLDLGLSDVTPVSHERFVARRQELFDVYLRAFSADSVVLTPGLIEAWFDTKSNQYIHITPVLNGSPLDNSRFEFDVIGYQQCLDDLNAVIRAIRRHNPNARFIVTVSPVPLYTTFTGQDIIVANSQSKGTLVAACTEVCRQNEFVDYFPSYEAVTLSRRGVWQKDRRHVTDRFVAKIVESVSRHYIEGRERKPKRQFELNLIERLNQLIGSGLSGRAAR